MLRHRFPQRILWTGNGPRLATAILLFWTTAGEPAFAQTSPPLLLAQQTPSSGAEQAAPHYSMEDLSYLLEPIALYPDPLLALILSASAFPVQIVEAERWIASFAAAIFPRRTQWTGIRPSRRSCAFRM